MKSKLKGYAFHNQATKNWTPRTFLTYTLSGPEIGVSGLGLRDAGEGPISTAELGLDSEYCE